MPNRILGSVLKGLETIFQFRGAQKAAPQEMELDLPIQVVADVSRIAGLGAGIGFFQGFTVFGDVHSHVAVGDIVTTGFPRFPSTAQNGYVDKWDPRNYWGWIYDTWVGDNDDADVDSAFVALVQGQGSIGAINAGSPANVRFPLFAGPSLAVGVVEDNVIPNDNLQRGPSYPMPLLIRPTELSTNDPFLYFRSSSKNAGTVTITMNTLFWVGPRGALPPK